MDQMQRLRVSPHASTTICEQNTVYQMDDYPEQITSHTLNFRPTNDRGEPTLFYLDSESVIAFLEDYDQERVLLLSETGSEESSRFEKNFREAMRTQRSDVLFALLSHDVDECSLVLEELKLRKEDLPALCYMGVGEDLRVCLLSDASVGYLESILQSVLESEDSTEATSSVYSLENEDLLAAIESIVSQNSQEKENNNDQ